MSQTIHTYCDCCGKEFLSTYWDDAPCKVDIRMGGPAQQFESFTLEHVCNRCRHEIQRVVRLVGKQPAPHNDDAAGERT